MWTPFVSSRFPSDLLLSTLQTSGCHPFILSSFEENFTSDM